MTRIGSRTVPSAACSLSRFLESMPHKLLKSKFPSPILAASGVVAPEPVDGDADVMSRKTYFHQECPTCGRTLQVRVEYLGRHIACQHCGSQFEACDPSTAACPPSQSGMAMLRRAEELLNAAESGIFKMPAAGGQPRTYTS